jgi:adenine-specific DNA-methyltransferase
MIDTDYNEESFVVRHCHFTGGDDPLKRLTPASSCTSTRTIGRPRTQTESRPFDKPSTGKIAVKVTNDYGDEVRKVSSV